MAGSDRDGLSFPEHFYSGKGNADYLPGIGEGRVPCVGSIVQTARTDPSSHDNGSFSIQVRKPRSFPEDQETRVPSVVYDGSTASGRGK